MAKLRDTNETQKSHAKSPERKTKQGRLLDHAPYSPDLAPSDFHLFPKLKQHLGGQRFSTDEEYMAYRMNNTYLPSASQFDISHSGAHEGQDVAWQLIVPFHSAAADVVQDIVEAVAVADDGV
nr:unnamed protein product [Callosobruchus chinensis]